MIYQEITTYSPIADADVTRVSTSDENGGEYFSVVRRPDRSKDWKRVREQVLDGLEKALARDDRQPGEVPVFDRRYQG